MSKNQSFYYKNHKGTEFIFFKTDYDTKSQNEFEKTFKFLKKDGQIDDDIRVEDFEFFSDGENITFDETEYIVNSAFNKSDGEEMYENYMKVKNEANDVFVLEYPNESLNKLYEFKEFQKGFGEKVSIFYSNVNRN